MKKKGFTPQFIAVIAMFTALAYVSVIIAKPIPNVSGFLSYEPKDAIIVIAGLLISPLASALISLLVSFIEMITISTTGPYGLIMNVLSTCAFAVPAAWIYHKNRTKKGAVIGLATGVVCMVICMLLWNYIITPLYMKVDRSVVAGMMLSVFLPFNLIKGGINAGITLLIYKPIVKALRSAKLVEASTAENGKSGFSVGFFIFSLVVLVTFVLAFLALIGIL
jgi:riboflavin transporter FmnP